MAQVEYLVLLGYNPPFKSRGLFETTMYLAQLHSTPQKTVSATQTSVNHYQTYQYQSRAHMEY